MELFLSNYSYILVASLLYGLNPSIQKLILNQGVSPSTLALICYIFSGLFCFSLGKIQRKDYLLKRDQIVPVLLTGCFGIGITDVMLNCAYVFIPVGFVTMIHFLFPVLVCFASCFFLGEKMNRKKAVTILLSVCGLFLITGSAIGDNFLGILFALISAVSYAFYILMNGSSAVRTIDPIVRTFYYDLAGSIVAVLSILVNGGFSFPEKKTIWPMCVVISLMGMTASILYTKSIARIGSEKTAFFDALEPVLSIVISALLYHYPIRFAQIIGCILMLVSIHFSTDFSGVKTPPFRRSGNRESG